MVSAYRQRVPSTRKHSSHFFLRAGCLFSLPQLRGGNLFAAGGSSRQIGWVWDPFRPEPPWIASAQSGVRPPIATMGWGRENPSRRTSSQTQDIPEARRPDGSSRHGRLPLAMRRWYPGLQPPAQALLLLRIWAPVRLNLEVLNR